MAQRLAEEMQRSLEPHMGSSEAMQLAVIEDAVMSTEVASPSGALVELNGDGILQIRGMGEFRANAAAALAAIEEYEYSDDDRQLYKKLRAAFSKLSKQVAKSVIEAQREVMSAASAERSEVEATLAEIISALDEKVRETEEKMKAERLGELEGAFASASSLLYGVDGLSLNDVMDTSWLNISSSMKAAQQELSSRLEAVSKLIAGGHSGERTLRDVAAALAYCGWDPLDAISFFKRQDEAELAAAAAAEAVSTSSDEVCEKLARLIVIVPAAHVVQVKSAIRAASPEAAISVS